MYRHRGQIIAMGCCLLVLALLMPFHCCAGEAEYISLEPPVLLPNGNKFKTWADQTVYAKTFYVDQRHPGASDEDPGSRDKPFLTINKAAQVVGPGERVIVKSGVYRELIEPRLGGEGPEKMISYEAAPGATVIVKGSRIFKPQWKESKKGDRTYSAALPDELFGSYNPFLTENASKEDIDLMPWAAEWAGKLPYTLGRGLVFQDGKRLAQQATYDDLAKTPGSYWVDKPAKKLHVHPLDKVTANGATFEITTQQHIFNPASTDLGFIRLKGLVFEHAGNGLPRTGVGAVFTNGGHHWIIEENIVRQVNSVGIEIGARTDETRQAGRADAQRAGKSPGYMIVRNNELYECGTGGIQGLTVKNALVEKNRIHHVGWLDVQRYWETGAIKLLLNDGTLVRRNIITEITAAPGIWLDYNNINSRVTQNVLADVQSVNGAIFIEASQVPNIVDRNFVWSVQGSGIYQHDCDHLTVAHNFVANCTGKGIEMRICQGRMVNGRLSTCTKNVVLNNILINTKEGIWFIDDDNTSNRNVFVNCGPPFDFAAWQKKGFGKDSLTAKINASFDPKNLRLTWSTPEELPFFEPHALVPQDFHNKRWPTKKAPAGPFQYPDETPTTIDSREF
ncbi:MAG: right-handed parallel beta-helix repeat-containing protein [Sedimentisphaerales bacterium]|nr:right-handed parallel beta-helix repeat-containing protein [Sedimentisphaerales bacterium]